MISTTTDLLRIEVGQLRENVNKYHPGIHPFYIEAIMPDQSIVDEPTPKPNVVRNLVNDNTTKPLIKTDTVIQGSNIMIYVPREFTLSYPEKWIPKGTKFLVAFIGKDINNPRIVGRMADA